MTTTHKNATAPHRITPISGMATPGKNSPVKALERDVLNGLANRRRPAATHCLVRLTTGATTRPSSPPPAGRPARLVDERGMKPRTAGAAGGRPDKCARAATVAAIRTKLGRHSTGKLRHLLKEQAGMMNGEHAWASLPDAAQTSPVRRPALSKNAERPGRYARRWLASNAYEGAG